MIKLFGKISVAITALFLSFGIINNANSSAVVNVKAVTGESTPEVSTSDESTSEVSTSVEDDGVICVFSKVLEGWQNPCVWAWDADGAGVFASKGWPGKEMTAAPGDEGWYYIFVPSTMVNVIVNANAGSVQTEAVAINPADVWLTIATETDDSTSVTKNILTPHYDKQTTGELPTYEKMMDVYAYIPNDWDTAAIWAWSHPDGKGLFTNWPGEEMTLLADGWYVYEVPAWVNKVIINDKGTTVIQSVDIDVLDNQEKFITDVFIQLTEANLDGKFEATVTYTKPVIIEDGFVAHFSVPETWTAPCVWAWSHPDGTNVYTTWPGEPLTLDEESGYFIVTLPGYVNRVIVNSGASFETVEQTVDLEVTGAEDVWIVLGEKVDGKYSANVTYSVPSETSDDSTSTSVDVSDTSTDVDNPTTDNTGLIIGLSIGGGAVVLLAIGAVIFFVLKKKKVSA